ncbi:hypothetical protein DL764_003336 [Monosporascus ibericus]|uniref:Uncharacterized protein n=1 Tax=Monosporascus ibericus TaxID=155417 RepID=A0A4Q4TJF1_9PEZI|nr:hypothetical protein DL764_003336 [Monosporascus ibericus]
MKRRMYRSRTGGDLDPNTTKTYPHGGGNGVSEACRASQGCLETSTDRSDEARTRSDIEASDYIDDVTYEDLTEDEDDTMDDAVASFTESSVTHFANPEGESKHGEAELLISDLPERYWIPRNSTEKSWWKTTVTILSRNSTVSDSESLDLDWAVISFPEHNPPYMNAFIDRDNISNSIFFTSVASSVPDVETNVFIISSSDHVKKGKLQPIGHSLVG